MHTIITCFVKKYKHYEYYRPYTKTVKIKNKTTQRICGYLFSMQVQRNFRSYNNNYYTRMYGNFDVSAFNQMKRQRVITTDTCIKFNVVCTVRSCMYKLFQHLLRGMHRASISHIIVRASKREKKRRLGCIRN